MKSNPSGVSAFSTFAIVTLVASIGLFTGTGCNNDPVIPSDPTVSRSESSSAVEYQYDAVPTGFEKAADYLLAKPLDKPSATEGKMFEVIKDTGVDFENYLDREKHPYQLIETGSGVALGDYDNDGIVDLYLIGADIQNKLYRGLGGFKFEDVTSSAGVSGRVNGQEVWGASASFADVNNDGFMDLFVCNMAAPNLLYMNNGDGTFSEESASRNVNYQGATKSANFCDYDRDGDLDMYLLTYQDFVSPGSEAFETVDGVKRVKKEHLEYHSLIAGRPAYAGEHDIFYRNDGKGVFTDVTKAVGISGYDRGLSCVWWDYDNDGWQDIYVGSDFKKPDHLYRNNHDGTFTDVLPSVVQHTPWFSMGMDTGDLNNDGLLDIMIADMSSTTHYKQKLNMGGMDNANWFLSQGEPRQYMKNALFINSGAGAFMETASMAGLSSTDWTWAIRFADLDNDGWQDVFVTNGHARDAMNADISGRFTELEKSGVPRSELDRMYAKIPKAEEMNLAFKNMGGLQFKPIANDWNLNHKGVSHAAAFADFDNDGDLDLVVNNYYEQSLIYRNNSSDGNRLIVELRGAENNTYGYGSRVEVWSGEQHFVKELNPVRGYLASDQPVVHFGMGSLEKIDKLAVRWPDGTRQEFNDLATGNLYRVIEPKDRRSKLPPKVTAPSKTLFAEKSEELGLKFKHAETEFDDYEREHLLPYQISQLGSGVAWGDVNGDGFPDAFCGGAAGQSGKLFLNRSGQKFESIVGPWKQHVDCEDKGALFFDSDGDGDLDLYVASGSNEGEKETLRDRLYLNNGKGKFSDAAKGALPELFDSSNSVSAVDFDKDGDIDLFVGSRSVPGKYPLTPSSRLLMNDGGSFTEADEATAEGLKEVGLVNSAMWADYDNDGWQDLLIALDWGPVKVFRNRKGKLYDATSDLKIGEFTGWWRGITAADLDDDGDLDFVATNQGQNTKYHTDPKHPHRLYYDDFDENGVMDLVEAEFEGDTEFPVRGRSCSSCTMPFIADKFETYHDFATASLSDIYETDIQKGPYREVTLLDSAIFWNEGDSFRIAPLPHLAQISPGFGVSVADFDGDSNLDILIANNFFANQPETGYMDGGLSWLLKGDGAGEFAATWPNESGIVLPHDSNGLAIADFDLDGDLDALVGVNNQKARLLRNDSEVERVRIEILGPKSNRNSIGAVVELSGPKAKRVIAVTGGDSYLSQSFGQSLSLAKKAGERFDSIKVTWADGKSDESDLDINSDQPIKLTYPN